MGMTPAQELDTIMQGLVRDIPRLDGADTYLMAGRLRRAEVLARIILANDPERDSDD